MRSTFKMKLVASLFVPAVAVLAAAPAFAAGDKPTTATTPSTATTAGKDSESLFDRLDANKDGILTTAEAQKDTSVNSMWKQLDADNDGRVSRAEFIASHGTAGAKGMASPKK